MNRVIFMCESPLRWWRMALVSHLLHHFHHSSKIEKLNSLEKEAIKHIFLLKRFKYWKFSVSLWPHKSKTQQKTLVAWKNSNFVKQNSKTLKKKLVKMKVKREKIKEIFLICYNSKKNYKRKNKELDTGRVVISHSYLLY